MKHTMKRLLAVLLVMAALCAHLTLGALAADDTKTIQEAIVQTALAYLDKGAWVQYDSTQMTAQSRLSHGESRISSGTAPEWAAADETLFSVCSDFCFNVYYNATGYELMGGCRNAVPKGNLTYGQALKLIALAVGEAEQPAGDHWASGYLTLAKTRGWLTADVDLDANVTRLEFCKIAAKAKGLTGQPASNPFTDCADTSVLALVNAGVIAGMTETTFEPSGLLTRAQISKIIWCLNQV